MFFQVGARSGCLGFSLAATVFALSIYNLFASATTSLWLFSIGKTTPHQVPSIALNLFRVILRLLWGITQLASVLTKKNAYLARMSLMLSTAQLWSWALLVIVFGHAMATGGSVPKGSWGPVYWTVAEFTSGVSSLLVSCLTGLLLLLELIFIIFCIDLHWSYFNVVYYGGVGWEGKDYVHVAEDLEDAENELSWEEKRQLI